MVLGSIAVLPDIPTGGADRRPAIEKLSADPRYFTMHAIQQLFRR